MNLARSLRYGHGMLARHVLREMYAQEMRRSAEHFPAIVAFRPERWMSLDPVTAGCVASQPAFPMREAVERAMYHDGGPKT